MMAGFTVSYSLTSLTAPRRPLPCVIRSQHSDLRPPGRPSDNIAPENASGAGVASFTSMPSDPLHFWDTHNGLLHHHDVGPKPHREDLLFSVEDDFFLNAQLCLLLNTASDRAEMHSILTQQRDNWNNLFQHMLTTASFTACLLSGLDGRAHCVGLILPALILNAGCATMMAIINQFQPSQLAEEQRTATRLFRKLAGDISYELQLASSLRQHAPSLLLNCRRRLQALDKSFPMPLTPGGLEKFPAKVVPPVLIEPMAISMESSTRGGIKAIAQHDTSHTEINNWNDDLVRELQEVASMLHHSDIPKYTGWAENLVRVNKCFAVAAPLLAASAALLDALAIAGGTAALPNEVSMWAAMCSVLAGFIGSWSHDMQLGMVFELYRNSAGYYADIEANIRETLDAPLHERENGVLFRQRVANALGRSAEAASGRMLPLDAQEAGVLF